MNLTFVPLLLALSACGEAPAPAPPEQAAALPAPEPAPAPEPEPEPEPAVPLADPVLVATASLLAGLPQPADSPLAELAASPEYQEWVARIDGAWQRYEAANRAKIAAWSDQRLSDLPAGPVFYPFSGPDLVNAVTLYPQGTQYTLLGMEAIGVVPSPHEDDDAEVMQGLARLERSMAYLLGRNYFITDVMAQQLQETPYNGITAVMIFFLARTGHQLVSARLVELDPQGEVIAEGDGDDSWGERTHGVEIAFRRDEDSPVRTVRYFQGDIADDHFTQRVGLSQHLEAQGELLSMAKAASYLMYYPAFDDVRRLMLSRSRAIVTESSGIPFHFLDQAPWELSLYGRYDRPIKDYEDRCQPDLKAALLERGEGELDFDYGYQYNRANHIVVARRAAGVPIAEPPYDAARAKGQNTLCDGAKVTVRQVGGR